MVYFLEDHFVTKSILVQVSLGLVDAAVNLRERSPKQVAVVLFNEKVGLASRCLEGLRDFIVGVVRKERVIAVDSSCTQAPIAGQEHPMVGMADDAHEKWTHPVHTFNFVIRFAVNGGLLTCSGFMLGLKRLGTQVDGLCRLRIVH